MQLKRSFFPLTVLILASMHVGAADAYVLKNIDMSKYTNDSRDQRSFDEDMLMSAECPETKTSGDFATLDLTSNHAVGSVGGAVGNLLGKLNQEIGTSINSTTLQIEVSSDVRALLLFPSYYNNNKKAVIQVVELIVKNQNGEKTEIVMDPDTSELLQSVSPQGESLLFCLDQNETVSEMTMTLTHNNVDGSRPTVDLLGFTNDPMKYYNQLLPK